MRRGLAGGASALALVAALVVAAPAVAADSGCGNAAIRAQQGVVGLPDCRAYELVSPQAKGNTDVAGETVRSATQVALDGNSVVYSSMGAFPGLVRGGALPYTYRALRTASGWKNESITPRSQSNFANSGWGAGNTGQVMWLTPDLKRAVVGTTVPLAPGASDSINLYTQTNPASDFGLLTPGGPSRAEVTSGSGNYVYFQGATPDLEHVVFGSSYPMAPGATQGPAYMANENLYEFSGGVVRLVSIDEHGDPITGNEIQLGMRNEFWELSRNTMQNAISRDGETIFFAAASVGTTPRLYVRRHGTDSDLITSDGGTFLGATPDGARTLIKTNSTGLQIYDVGSATAQDISTSGKFVAASENLDRIYFVDTQEHEAGQPPIPTGSEGLYLWHAGAIRYIATVGPASSSSDFHLVDTAAALGPSRYVTRTDDGTTLVFVSSGSVDGYDNAGRLQAYRYDAVRDELTCMSCPPSGKPTQDAYLYYNNHFAWFGAPYGHSLGDLHNVSADGRRVFFQTAEALVPQDTNGKIDVYVWEGGVVRLLSGGTGRYDTRFLSASPSGDDVFVVTRNRLLPGDRDDYVDVYDVRADGGFVTQASPAPECHEDDCQGAPAGVPSTPAVASASFAGADETAPPAPRAAHFSVGAVSRTVLRQAAVSGRLTVRVAVTQAGRVTVSGTTRLPSSSRSVRVLHAVRTASKAATVQIPLRLSASARRALAAGRTLTVHLAVTYSKARGARRSVLRLSAPSRGRAGA